MYVIICSRYEVDVTTWFKIIVVFLIYRCLITIKVLNIEKFLFIYINNNETIPHPSSMSCTILENCTLFKNFSAISIFL